MHLLPCPRAIHRGKGVFVWPRQATLCIPDSELQDLAKAAARRLNCARRHTQFAAGSCENVSRPTVLAERDASLPERPDTYVLSIAPQGVRIRFRTPGGLHAAVSTLRQLRRESPEKLPVLEIRDWADFPVRGVMLDISRGRVPKLATLMDLAGHLADFKINQLQLYTEHTFAYSDLRPIWQEWGALTGPEIRRLDAHCRALGIDLVPNQNSFGHLREFLAYPPLRHLAEVDQPYEAESGDFLRYPSTLAPANPGTLPFLRNLFDELLPNFSSKLFNVGCDETWDLGRGQSRKACDRLGKGRIYLRFLKRIHREVSRRKRQMLFWGDIILKYPKLIRDLPKSAIALNWGYEADHPFDRECALFARSGMQFYVCPGTSTWMTLVGRHDNALANLRSAARAGLEHGARGYLITDWGDGGHPQPLAVSYAPYLAGAAMGWCLRTFEDRNLAQVLSRDVFGDPTGHTARAALALGVAHRRLDFHEHNLTPLGAVLAAPRPEERELFCRHGLDYYRRIPAKNIRATLTEIRRCRSQLGRARPTTEAGRMLVRELAIAARMSEQSCQFMLWQQAVADSNVQQASRLARAGIAELRSLNKEFTSYWRSRNKASSSKSTPFLAWRIADYARGDWGLPAR